MNNQLSGGGERRNGAIPTTKNSTCGLLNLFFFQENALVMHVKS
jgi:hypothetical protein